MSDDSEISGNQAFLDIDDGNYSSDSDENISTSNSSFDSEGKV